MRWTPRTKAKNKAAAEAWKRAPDQTTRQKIEQETGTRWSELHRLECFDPVRCTVIDPMYNLFSGTAERMVRIWLDTDNIATGEKLLTRQHLDEMEEEMKKLSLSLGYKVAGGNIASRFSGMTWTNGETGP